MAKKLTAALLAAIMTLSMSVTAFAAAPTNTSVEKRYYMDLQSMTDQKFEDSSVDLEMYVNNKCTLLKKDGDTCIDGYRIDETDLGSALLFRYDPNGKLDSESMNVTYVPIRRVANVFADYGVKIDWNDKTKNVVLDTPKGRIEFPVGATSITAPDGTVYEEQTYRFPDGSPINITSARNGRVYVTVRFISTFLMPDCTYRWKGTEKLTVDGVMDGTVVERTYGINENYVNDNDERIEWSRLPTYTKAVSESTLANGQSVENGPSTAVSFEVDGVSMGLEFSYGSQYHPDEDSDVPALRISFACIAAYDEQRTLIDAMLQDLICDSDREAVLTKLDEIREHMSIGWTPRGGLTAEAQTWRESFVKTYTLSEVKLMFDENLRYFYLVTK